MWRAAADGFQGQARRRVALMAGVMPVTWNQPAPGKDRVPVDIAGLGEARWRDPRGRRLTLEAR